MDFGDARTASAMIERLAEWYWKWVYALTGREDAKKHYFGAKEAGIADSDIPF